MEAAHLVVMPLCAIDDSDVTGCERLAGSFEAVVDLMGDTDAARAWKSKVQSNEGEMEYHA